MEGFLFAVVGVLAIAFALGMLMSTDAVHSALFLIGNFGCVAFLYLMLDAPFLAMVQIAVYAGAIMVLFLFVIMLLKADQEQDPDTRQFPWISAAAIGLGIVLMIGLGVPLLVDNFTLPGAPAREPLVRIVHAAQAPTATVEISGNGLSEPLRAENIAFGEASSFNTLPAGDYTVQVNNASSNTPMARPVTVTLGQGEVISILVDGELNLTEGTLVEVTKLENDILPVANDGTRLSVLNRYSSTPVTLVDLGADKVLTTSRDDASVIIDPVIASNVELNGEAVVANYQPGVHTLAFVTATTGQDGKITGYSVLETLNNFDAKKGTEIPLILVKDAEESTEYSLTGAIRPRILSGLTIDTEPSFGSPMSIGRILFTVYLLPVNLVGLLLLVALVGVIIMSRPAGNTTERTGNVRRRVSRPLVNVISQQTGGDVVVETPKLGSGSEE